MSAAALPRRTPVLAAALALYAAVVAAQTTSADTAAAAQARATAAGAAAAQGGSSGSSAAHAAAAESAQATKPVSATAAHQPAAATATKLAAQRLAIDSAVRLQAGGDLAAATHLLDEQHGACAAGTAGAGCRQLLDYSLGYVLQQSSAAALDPKQLLGRAAASYQRVLDENPNHAPTLENLATISAQLGEPQIAAGYLRRALDAEPSSTSTYALELGDLLLASGSPTAARGAFRMAADRGDEAARSRLVLTYTRDPAPGAGAELLRLGGEWESLTPTAAADAYDATLRLATSAGDTALAQEALLRRVSQAAENRGVSWRDLARLPEGSGGAAGDDLRGWLQHPELSLPKGSWWRSSAERAETLARLGVLVGKGRLGSGDAATAEAIWRQALELARPFDRASVDLRTELALLYHRHPELDRFGVELVSTEEALLEEKGVALAHGDRKTAQRYDTALGLIYADRGQCESDPPWRGGLYQLGHAVAAAEDRATIEKVYLPVPLVRQRLAACQRAAGATREAAATLLATARDYLDLDDSTQAGRQLAAAGELAATAWPQGLASIRSFGEVLATRRRAAAMADGKDEVPAEQLAEFSSSAWLAPSWDLLQPDLVARQRFKATADLAIAATRSATAATEALRLAQAALAMVTDSKTTLSGAGDLLRVERLQDIVGGAVGIAPAVPRVELAVAGDQRGVPLALASASEAKTVVLDPDARTALRIVQRLGVERVIAAGLHLQIRGDAITIREAAPGVDVAALERELNQI